MKIGILQAGQAPEELRAHIGDYPALFARLLAGQSFDFATWHVEGMDFPASVREADGWLITGSRHGVYEDHAFIAPLEQFIRDAFDTGLPVVGICFGHQIMAQALGGKVEKFAGGWAVGAQDYEIEGERLVLNAWHQDQVITPPAGAATIGRNAFCAHAALAYGRQGLSLQAHPEFEDSFIQGLIDTRGRGVVPDALLQAASASQGGARDSSAIGQRIAAHFKQFATAPAGSESQ
ncbi:GMP synthase-like glutamine amidotransferase [Roseinatronobacter thiooxidans]|uniref:GMP synthase-like glutamine amidotransferase n=1 Tax=Roseinatronobacter thiooxidans TaxID=121821 RepID=A0A2W7QF10_9RHOB|nr:type 1 glutamine amidotransferase [Roseinatronobacter thiooxidans]PZX47128.1 GMP synthase-like glutamine amidotransferase [Roseinatronobacter thiooxidans]